MEYNLFRDVELRMYCGETYVEWMQGSITNAIKFPNQDRFHALMRCTSISECQQIINQCLYMECPYYYLNLDIAVHYMIVPQSQPNIINPVYLDCMELKSIPTRTKYIKCQSIPDFNIFTRKHYEYLYLVNPNGYSTLGADHFLKNVTIGRSNMKWPNVQNIITDELDVGNLPIGAVHIVDWDRTIEKLPTHTFLFPTCQILFDNLSMEILRHKIFVIQQKMSEKHLSIMDYLISTPTILIRQPLTNDWRHFPNPGFTFICKYPNYLTK